MRVGGKAGLRTQASWCPAGLFVPSPGWQDCLTFVQCCRSSKLHYALLTDKVQIFFPESLPFLVEYSTLRPSRNISGEKKKTIQTLFLLLSN